MATIETQDFWTRAIVEPVGIAAAALRAKIPVGKVRDVEKDLDLYAGFYWTKAQLLNRDTLSKRNQKRLGMDDEYRDGKLYLVTGASVIKTPTMVSKAKNFVAKSLGVSVKQTYKTEILECAFFVNEALFADLHLPVPTKENSVGNGRVILNSRAYDVENLSQNWGSSRSRIKTVSSRVGSFEDKDLIEASLAAGQKKTGAKWGFWRNMTP